MSEREFRIKICEEIGCSGVDKFCPGNPTCSILQKVLTKEKTYTLSDLEQARKQGAEDERARCIRVAELEYVSAEATGGILGENDMEYNKCVRDIVTAVRALGPIGETREETEERVRRETVGKVRERACHLDDQDGCPVIFNISMAKLEAIAEGK